MVASEDFFVIARVFHVIGVVLWIGGIAFLALVVVPTLRAMPDSHKSFKIFAAVEGRFKGQAKIVTVITGLSGFFMLFWLDAWDRYLDLSFWWVHLMTLIWAFFTLVLFVIEPVLIKGNVHEKAMSNPAATFKFVNHMLKVLTALSLLAILGAITGVHG
jgi:uncharacterized membrane protein